MISFLSFWKGFIIIIIFFSQVWEYSSDSGILMLSDWTENIPFVQASWM